MVTSIFKEGIVVFRCNTIEDYACNLYIFAKSGEPINGSGYREGRRGGIDKQDNRNIQFSGNICTAPLHLVITVKHSHHPFNNIYIARCSIAAVYLLNVLFRGDKEIQVY